jgi:hypothetical protein
MLCGIFEYKKLSGFGCIYFLSIHVACRVFAKTPQNLAILKFYVLLQQDFYDE